MVLGFAGARAVGYAPAGVNYSNFMDTRLTWTFGDDDVLHPTGELIPLSPSFSISDRPQYRLFFDSLNSRFAGRENLTHLVLYKKLPGFIKNLTTEAAVVLRFDLSALAANTGNLNQALYDSGSYIRVFYKTGGTELRPEGLSATFLPLDADRVRVGYLYDITWGGSASYINQSIFPSLVGSAPGAKLQYDGKNFYAFGAFKTGTIVQPQQVVNPGGENDVETVNVGESNYGFLGGFGVDITKHFRIDASGGYFQQGRFDLEDVRGLPVYTYGGAARVVIHDKMPVPQSVDLVLYRNDPNAPMTLFALPVYKPELTKWSISLESDVIGQHLKNYDVEGRRRRAGKLRGGRARRPRDGVPPGELDGHRPQPRVRPAQRPGVHSVPVDASAGRDGPGDLRCSRESTTTSLSSTSPPGVGGGIQLPSTFKMQHRRQRARRRATNHRRALARRRVDPPVRRGSPADRADARELAVGPLDHPLGRRLGSAHLRQQRDARHHRPERRHGVTPRLPGSVAPRLRCLAPGALLSGAPRGDHMGRVEVVRVKARTEGTRNAVRRRAQARLHEQEVDEIEPFAR